MAQFEYRITLHPAESFKDVVYFCSSEGRCELKEVPADQIGKLEEVLNEQGQRGWELAQATFGNRGVLIIWRAGLMRTVPLPAGSYSVCQTRPSGSTSRVRRPSRS